MLQATSTLPHYAIYEFIRNYDYQLGNVDEIKTLCLENCLRSMKTDRIGYCMAPIRHRKLLKQIHEIL